ncbi:MAG: hypothetical protein GF329_03960 [Candidatus Lokiarchaeota archaeon]|nr:hypothetical protein [Candidatus Lokiarchaeota archaeon]
MTEFIFMLTENDVTRKDALEIYENIRDTNLKHIGFKDIGLSMNELRKLTKKMNEDKKTTYLEIISTSKKETIKSTKIGIDLEVDYLIGGLYSNIEPVLDLLSGTTIKFFPYIGEIYDHPCKLRGSIRDFKNQYDNLKESKVDGINLLAYRHEKDSELLIETMNKVSEIPIIIAGDINSKERIIFLKNLGIWAFTVGTAIFNKQFVHNGSYKDNINYVLNLINDK